MTFNRKRLIMVLIWSCIGLLVSSILVPAFGPVTTSGVTTTRSTGLSELAMMVITAISTVGPGVAAFFLMGKPPPRQGECQQCGYNLTGNTSGTCPECGTKVETDDES